MEKPGIGRKYSRVRTGLLGFLAGVIAVLSPVFSQESGYFPDPDYYMDYGLVPEPVLPDEFALEMEVLLETSPEIPKVHSEWTIRILVNYPNPQDVSMVIPDLPPSLVLDRIRTTPRFVGRDGGANPEPEEKWTAVEFFFIPGQAGPVSLAPFEARAPGRLGYSPRVSAVIRDDSREDVLWAAWDLVPDSLTIGQSAEVRLHLITEQAENRQDAAVSYLIEAPVNALVETLDITEAGPGEFILRFQIIPLAGSAVRIPPALLKYGDASLTVSSREFRVLPVVSSGMDLQRPDPVPDRDMITGTGAEAGGGAARSGKEPTQAPPFPDASRAVFPLFRTGYDRAVREARSYWEQGLYAEALAVLRLNERELAAGPVLADLRRAAETALGIGFTGDETWRPRFFFLVLAGAASFILIFILLAIRGAGGGRNGFPVTSGSSWGYTCIVIVLCGAIGIGFCGFFRPGWITPPGTSGAGILRETGAFRVPENGTVPAVLFREGEAVQIRSIVDAWVYIESFGGKAGWVPLDRIIPY